MIDPDLIDDLASSGRYGDEYLLHINGEELAALDALAPEGLTINPETGLPEAFSLSEWLPAIVGIGGAMMGLPTWAAALGSGAVSTAQTGDIGKGLMSGLLTYAGGNLGQGLAEAGSAAANTAAMSAGEQALTNAAMQGGDVLGQAAQMGAAENLAPSILDQVGAGIAQPGAFMDVLSQGDVWKPGAAGLLMAAGMGDEEQAAQAADMAEISYGPGVVPANKQYRGALPTSAQGREQMHYFAEGGPVLGPGGGMDDLVPAMIEGQQPAALSNDEFVIPARTVAALGDGSSEEGHRKLYSLIKAIDAEVYKPEPGVKMKRGLKELMKLYG